MVAVFQAEADSCSDAWFKTLIKVLTEGDEIKTQYDNPTDPPSRDAAVQVVIRKPLTNKYSINGKPRLIESRDYHNKYYLDCHPCDVFCIESVRSNYIEEVLIGTQDASIADSESSMPYTYHDRLFNYKAFSLEDAVHVDYPVKLIEDEKKVTNHKKLVKAGLITKDKREKSLFANSQGLLTKCYAWAIL